MATVSGIIPYAILIPTINSVNLVIMKILLATQNPDKLKELKALFDVTETEVVSAIDFPHLPEVVEDGETLEENARKKALTLAIQTKLWALADDSGLEVEALDGAPGVYSARYAGEEATYRDNNIKLVGALADQQNRKARFRCVIALSSPSGIAECVEGSCTGVIAPEVQGEHGFGYDPLFIPDGFTQTFAELDPATKNRISHRGQALQRAKAAWAAMLQAEPDWPTR